LLHSEEALASSVYSFRDEQSEHNILKPVIDENLVGAATNTRQKGEAK